MGMFKANPCFSADPELVCVAGSYVFNSSSANPLNTVMQPALFRGPQNALGACIGQNETVAPLASRIVCVNGPTTAYHPAVATNANNAGIIMLDARAFPSDIVCVLASCTSYNNATGGAVQVAFWDAAVLGIDQTNNFIYIACLNSGGSINNLYIGLTIHYKIFFKDTFAA